MSNKRIVPHDSSSFTLITRCSMIEHRKTTSKSGKYNILKLKKKNNKPFILCLDFPFENKDLEEKESPVPTNRTIAVRTEKDHNI